MAKRSLEEWLASKTRILKIDLIPYSSEVRSRKNPDLELFDPVRKKWVSGSPEEWVRQCFIQFMQIAWAWPLALISVERELKSRHMTRRWDLLGFDNSAQPLMLCEFKNPEVIIDHRVIQQVSGYLTMLDVPFVCITNGVELLMFQWDSQQECYKSLDDLPVFKM